LDELLPDGKQFRPLKESYLKDPDHGWSYGRHPDMAAGTDGTFTQHVGQLQVGIRLQPE
jgi:hypothetical protein